MEEMEKLENPEGRNLMAANNRKVRQLQRKEQNINHRNKESRMRVILSSLSRSPIQIAILKAPFLANKSYSKLPLMFTYPNRYP